MGEIREMLGTIGVKGGVLLVQHSNVAVLKITDTLEVQMTPAQLRHLARQCYTVAKNIDAGRPTKQGESE